MREETNARKQKSANQISVIKNVERKQTFSGTGVLILAEYKNGRNMQKSSNFATDRRKTRTNFTVHGFFKKKAKIASFNSF